MTKLEGVPILKGEFVLFLHHPTQNIMLTLDKRWKVEKIDDTHYRVSPSLDANYGHGDVQAFHTTNPFIVEIAGTRLNSE
jgi:hypothetical protein